MEEKNNSIQVWDVFVRVFHWTLVALMLAQYLTGDEFKNLHVKTGYFLMGLVLARILWGFIGPKHARFSDFVYGPGPIIDYLKGLIKGRPKHYLGHNPAGGLMIIILLFSLLVTGFTGLKTLGAKGQGPLADDGISMIRPAYADKDEYDDDYRKHRKGRKEESKEYEFWEEIHEAMTGFMLFLIVVHISGVIVSSWVHRENLILAMITGRKNKRSSTQ